MSLSLEELESRCDSLQRRVAERTPVGHANRSPPRPSRYAPSAGALNSSSSARPPSPRGAAAPVSPVPPLRQHSGASPRRGHDDGTVLLSGSDISFAVSSLEREKTRLEEQLRLVNLHLAAYRHVQQQGQRGTQAALQLNNHSARSEASGAMPSHPGSAGSTTPRYAHDSSATQNPPASPSRRRSPPRGRSPPRASIQTEQIYEELRQIRRAREEREAQRRAAMGVSSPSR